MEKVSIIIPVYNGADFLAEAIDSALAQTWSNLEVLVINDGSRDDGATRRVAESYGDRIRYFEKPNGGVASALNLGIRNMEGEYFSWLSHDDLYLPQKVEREMARMAERPERDTVVYSDYAVFTTDPSAAVPVKLPQVAPDRFRYWITVENRLHGCTLLIPREAFDRAGLFDETLRTTQDYDLWFRMARHFRFEHLPEPLVLARSHEGQGSHQMRDTALRECNLLLSNFVRTLAEDEVTRGAGAPPAEAYLEVARSMYRRGFDQAGDTALALARSRCKASGGFWKCLRLRVGGGTRPWSRLAGMARRLYARLR